MGVPTLTRIRKTDIMSKRKYSIHKAPGDRLTDREHATIGLFEYVRMINKLKALTGKEIDLVENGSLLPFADETAQRDKLLIYERGC